MSVMFTDEQVQYINAMFPENIDDPKTDKELYVRLGQRQVVKHLLHLREMAKRKAPK